MLTLSERQAVAGLEAVAEQDEGLRGGRVGEVDHLQAALQRQLVAQVEQVLLLHGDARLGRHLLKEARHPGRTETRRRVRVAHHVTPHLFFSEIAANLLLFQFIPITRLVTDSPGSTHTLSVL